MGKRVYENGEYRDATPEEIAAWEAVEDLPIPEPTPTPEERIQRLEQTKADQTAVDELNEALEMILEGVTE